MHSILGITCGTIQYCGCTTKSQKYIEQDIILDQGVKGSNAVLTCPLAQDPPP